MFKLKEQILLFRVKNGDRNAFGQIYDYYIKSIYRFIYFKVPTPEDAEDLASQTFIKALEYITETKKEIKSLQALLYQIARNLVIDMYRQKSSAAVPLDEELKEVIPDKEMGPKEKVEIISDIKNVEGALRKVPDTYREVIVLRYIEQFSNKEIAKILDRSEGAVRVIIHRGLNKLREVIQSEDKG